MSCEIFEEPSEIILGCTDPLASNYNPLANTDDDSCVIVRPPALLTGCMDPLAINYDPSAEIEDNSQCEYEISPDPIDEKECFTTIDEISINSDGTVTITATNNNLTNVCCNRLGSDSWFYSNGVCYWKEVLEEPIVTIGLSENIIEVDDDRCNEIDVCIYFYLDKPNEKCLGTEQPIPSLEECGDFEPYISNSDGTVSFIDSSGEIAKADEISPSCCAYYGYVFSDGFCRSDLIAIPPKIITAQLEIEGLFSGATQTPVTVYNSDTNGFCEWVQLCTTITFPELPIPGEDLDFEIDKTFKLNLRLDGMVDCCDYDIRVDDIQVKCTYIDTIEVTNEYDCPGFNLKRTIDNKKSWLYHDGDFGINRVFAPSIDAEIPWRYTNYEEQSDVLEKHNKLVLNSKELDLTFNMCADCCYEFSPCPKGYTLSAGTETCYKFVINKQFQSGESFEFQSGESYDFQDF